MKFIFAMENSVSDTLGPLYYIIDEILSEMSIAMNKSSAVHCEEAGSSWKSFDQWCQSSS